MSLLTVFLLVAAIGEDGRPCQERTPVVVVSDGSSEWTGQSARRVVESLRASMSSCRVVQVVPFDAEPARGDGGDLLVFGARTPMREAIDAGFAHLAEAPGPRTMVVVAHEQFYPSGVPGRRLLDLARRTHTTVHTIYVERRHDQEAFDRRLNRRLRSRFVWFVETFVVDERGYSARETARLLKTMASATGGTACTVDDGEPSPECIARVTAGIASCSR
jgi:hypothetical protein